MAIDDSLQDWFRLFDRSWTRRRSHIGSKVFRHVVLDDRLNILANGLPVATQNLAASRLGEFIDRTYEIPAAALAAAPEGRLTVKFVAAKGLAGGVYDVRLLRSTAPLSTEAK